MAKCSRGIPASEGLGGSIFGSFKAILGVKRTKCFGGLGGSWRGLGDSLWLQNSQNLHPMGVWRVHSWVENATIPAAILDFLWKINNSGQNCPLIAAGIDG